MKALGLPFLVLYRKAPSLDGAYVGTILKISNRQNLKALRHNWPESQSFEVSEGILLVLVCNSLSAEISLKVSNYKKTKL